MDCKIGIRTYRERKKDNQEIRLDTAESLSEFKEQGKIVYRKISKNINRFVMDENGKNGVTLAYMKMCDTLSTTSKYGFRILVRKR